MRLLLVAALGAEATPLYPLLSRPRPVTPRLTVGQVGEHRVGVLVCGVGPTKARTRTHAVLERFTPDTVLSVGTCGALDDRLSIGDVRWAGSVGRPDLDPEPSWAPEGVSTARVVTVSRPVFTPSARAGLAARRWQLVEMEAHAVREASGTATFGALKVVSDHAGREPDAALASSRLPSPATIGRFKARALKLVGSRLVPELRSWLRS